VRLDEDAVSVLSISATAERQPLEQSYHARICIWAYGRPGFPIPCCGDWGARKHAMQACREDRSDDARRRILPVSGREPTQGGGSLTCGPWGGGGIRSHVDRVVCGSNGRGLSRRDPHPLPLPRSALCVTAPIFVSTEILVYSAYHTYVP
jgi:hypothetical protein